jgi:hypothetical protein
MKKFILSILFILSATTLYAHPIGDNFDEMGRDIAKFFGFHHHSHYRCTNPGSIDDPIIIPDELPPYVGPEDMTPPVPEPATMLLLGLGAAGIYFVKRKSCS